MPLARCETLTALRIPPAEHAITAGTDQFLAVGAPSNRIDTFVRIGKRRERFSLSRLIRSLLPLASCMPVDCTEGEKGIPLGLGNASQACDVQALVTSLGPQHADLGGAGCLP